MPSTPPLAPNPPRSPHPPSTEPFLELADLLPEVLLLVAADGTVLLANRAARDELELDLTGRSLRDLVAAANGGADGGLESYLRSCSRSRQLVLGSLELRRAGGDCVTYRAEGWAYRPRTAEAGATVLLRLRPKEATIGRFLSLNERIDSLGREVARRRRIERELREQREWLAVTLSSIGDAVIATDAVGQVIFMNPIAEHLTGWAQPAAAGLRLEEVFHIVNEETRAEVPNPVFKVLREGTISGLANHTVLLARDGRELPIDDCAAPIRGADGAVGGVVLIFHDVSERRDLERELVHRAERLAEADRRKDDFLAMLAHELRNPLAPIRNALHLLELPEAEPAMRQRARGIMARQIDHLVRLVDDLLDVSRITRGKIELRRERIDFAAEVARTAELARPAAEAAGLSLQLALPPQPVFVDADPVRLHQMFANLLNNAIKYTEPGGSIGVSVEPEAARVLLRVRDTGIGIPPDLLPVIFEPFTQAHRALDRSQGGLGLGLTLVRTLVEMHGGSVEARSTGRAGAGSELVLSLPRAAAT
jgi:PAS domain S-box-containing protein